MGKYWIKAVAEGCIQPNFEYLQGWRLHNHSGNLFQCLTTLARWSFYLKKMSFALTSLWIEEAWRRKEIPLLLPYALLERPHETPAAFAYYIRLLFGLSFLGPICLSFPSLHCQPWPPISTYNAPIWDRDADGNTFWCQSCFPVKDFRALQTWLQGHSLHL